MHMFHDFYVITAEETPTGYARIVRVMTQSEILELPELNQTSKDMYEFRNFDEKCEFLSDVFGFAIRGKTLRVTTRGLNR